MAKYIKAEDLKQEMLKESFYPVFMKNLIEQMPAADVVQVVRCEHCRYWDECRIGEGFCEHPVNGITRDYTTANDYCSYGERRTDNE